MCGLAGFVRHPDSDGHRQLIRYVTEALRLQEHRGKHATGFAAVDTRADDAVLLWKRAVKPSVAVDSDAWKEAVELVGPRFTSMMGHVRYATQPNAHVDDAAHPFLIGGTTGAHNGIIYNWREIANRYRIDSGDWRVDSEAAIYLLERFTAPRALGQLDGYWALTWTKGRKLHITRTREAQLTCAYLPKLRALIWASEARVLKDAARRAGLAAAIEDTWVPQPGIIYGYDPTAFTKKETHADKIEVQLKSRKRERYDSSATSGGRHGRVWDQTSCGWTPRVVQRALPFPENDRVDTLERQIAELKSALAELRAELEATNALVLEMLDAERADTDTPPW